MWKSHTNHGVNVGGTCPSVLVSSIFFLLMFFSFWSEPVAGCGAVSSFEGMCEGMIRLQMAVFWRGECVCFSAGGLMFPGFVKL